jgi:ABC-type nitrate/sulfonate/bicarbonate transport system permease component
MLWEIWGRHKWMFPLHGAALALSVCLVRWKERGAPESLGPPLVMIPPLTDLAIAPLALAWNRHR